jgi:hypothetical protein
MMQGVKTQTWKCARDKACFVGCLVSPKII